MKTDAQLKAQIDKKQFKFNIDKLKKTDEKLFIISHKQTTSATSHQSQLFRAQNKRKIIKTNENQNKLLTESLI